MITADDFIGYVKLGCHVRVGRTATERVLQFTDRSGRIAREERLSLSQYEAVMCAVIEVLAAGDGKSWRVNTGFDFYGSAQAEVRSGLLRRKIAKLGIAPRHIEMLRTRIAKQAEPDKAA